MMCRAGDTGFDKLGGWICLERRRRLCVLFVFLIFCCCFSNTVLIDALKESRFVLVSDSSFAVAMLLMGGFFCV